MSDFKLTSPGPDAQQFIQAEALMGKIKQLAASRRMRRPMLEAWSFRIEAPLHHELKKLAEEHKQSGISMTDIVHGLLEVMVPLLRVGRKQETKPAVDLSQLDAEKQSQLVGLLASLSQILTPSSKS